jgi:hypothetical protein
VREVREVWRAPGVLETLGAEARRTFELLYTEEQNYRSLKEIYEHAMSRSRVLQEM